MKWLLYDNKLDKTCIKVGNIHTNSMTSGTMGGASGFYYYSVSVSVSGKSIQSVVATYYNNDTVGLGGLGDPIIISDITSSGFKVWTKNKIPNYYIRWIAVFE